MVRRTLPAINYMDSTVNAVLTAGNFTGTILVNYIGNLTVLGNGSINHGTNQS